MAYEEIFEKEARWLMGRTILNDIISFLRGKPLFASLNASNNSFDIIIPLPDIINDLTGESVCISNIIPEELIEVFNERIIETKDQYLREDYNELNGRFYGRPMNDRTLSEFNYELELIERRRRAEMKDELWKVFAKNVGITPFESLEIKTVFRY